MGRVHGRYHHCSYERVIRRSVLQKKSDLCSTKGGKGSTEPQERKKTLSSSRKGKRKVKVNGGEILCIGPTQNIA